MPEDIEAGIVKLLKKLGYKNVEGNCGTVWFDSEGKTFAISAMECESGGW